MTTTGQKRYAATVSGAITRSADPAVEHVGGHGNLLLWPCSLTATASPISADLVEGMRRSLGIVTYSQCLQPGMVARSAIVPVRDHFLAVFRSDLVEPIPATSAGQVKWIKDRSGLTWDQLARLFSVSRRAVHHWASGARVNAVNGKRVADLCALLHRSELASGTEMRRHLLNPGPDGPSIYDALRASWQRGEPIQDLLTAREKMG